MLRLFIALGAGAGLVLAAGVGLHGWLAAEFARGESHGRAVVAEAAAQALERQRAADAAVLARAQADVAALQDARERLQETYDALEKQIAATRRADRLCLDPGLVRALDAIGRAPSTDAARP